MKRFENKIAIVTGASGGIGLATALRLAREGARLAILARDPAKLAAALGKVEAAGAPEALMLAGDVADERTARALVRTACDRFGGLDVVVNNAGALTTDPLVKLSAKDWRHVFEVDILGAFHFAKQTLLHARKGAAIVNVSSVHAFVTSTGIGPYAAAKAALDSLTRTITIEGRERGIRANSILPGAIETPFLHTNPNVESGEESFDPKELGTPDDVAAAIAFLASDEACFIQGATLVVDGGRTCRL